MNQVEKCHLFRKLDGGSDILALPNAWDVIAARVYESVGFSAIGTTSTGLAAALGYGREEDFHH